MSFIDTNSLLSWGFTSSGGLQGVYRLTSNPGVKYLNYVSNQKYTFLQNKNYMFVTVVQTGEVVPFVSQTPFGATISFRLSSPFLPNTAETTETLNLPARQYGGSRVYHFASPISTLRTNQIIQIGATENLTFQTPSQGISRKIIKRVDVYELDFYINGYRETAEKPTGSPEYGTNVSDQGWNYDPNTESYWWITSPGGGLPKYSTSGSGLTSVRNYNFIARPIEYDYFNLQFDYATFSGNPTDGVDIYLGLDLADRTTWQNVGSLKGLSVSSVRHLLVGLTGSNTDGSKNFVIISGSTSTNNSRFTAKISNINIYGGYHPLNNDQFLMTNSSNFANPTQLKLIGATAATYSFITGYASTIANTSSNIGYIRTKVGNGSFRAGIWEAGVWNNGWREDTVANDFDDVLIALPVTGGVKWRFQLIGRVGSTNNIEVGDKVSIGNIVGIDINGERKVFKNYFTVLKKNEEALILEVDTTFPLRRIEKDSQNHKIKVTKNIWLSGAFLNGYFTGVWNSGLFKGGPFSTEMYDTHWIDGKFDGGHFHSNYPNARFNDTYYIVANDWNLSTTFEGKLGLTFSSSHPFVEGDWIIVDKDSKNLNSQYDGMTRVLKVIDEHLIVVDKNFGQSSNLESGLAFRWTSTSLIQKFDFNDTNLSTKTSNQSSVSADIFRFNSWIDVNYDPTRSVSIGRNTRDYDRISNRSINRNNLFGYPTYDILSSNSTFRDSHTLQKRNYKLGTKYKIFEDPIDDGSFFTEAFEPSVCTDQIVLKFNILERNSSGATITFTPGKFIKIIVVPISATRYNTSEVKVLCSNVPEVSNPITMAQNIVSAINNNNFGYTASSIENIVTIRDLSNNSYGTKGLEIEAVNYALKADNSSGNTTVIYPDQNTIEQTSNTSNNTLGQNTTQLTNQTYSPGQAPLRFGRIIEGVGYENLTNLGWEITQASFSNSDLRRTEISDEDDNIKGEELQINVVNEGITMNNNRIAIETERYSVVEFDIMSYSLHSPYFTYINEELGYSRRGIQLPEKVDFPVIHLSNLNFDYVNTGGGRSSFGGGQFTTPVLRQYLPITYLPVNTNINHIFTENTYRLDSSVNITPLTYESNNLKFKKYEYFYSKRDLMMKVLGNGENGGSQSFVVLDNIKMFEVDMIPFFKYFNEENIYKGVQVPFQGKAPEIDYETLDYNFLDNLSIGLDSMNIQQSLTPLTGVSSGILAPPPQIQINLLSTINLIFDELNSDTGVPIGSPIAQQVQQPGNESTL